MSEKRACKQCGLEILVVEVVTPGKKKTRKVALDLRVPVYHVVKDKKGEPDIALKSTSGSVLAYHGAVCNGRS